MEPPLSGRQIPRTGDVIISRTDTEESLRAIIKEDPSSIHDGAEYQIISMLIPDLTVDKEEIPGHKTRNTPREPHLDLILGIDDTSEPGNQPVHPKKISSHRNHPGFTKKDAADEDTTYQRLLSEGDFIHESHLSLGKELSSPYLAHSTDPNFGQTGNLSPSGYFFLNRELPRLAGLVALGAFR